MTNEAGYGICSVAPELDNLCRRSQTPGVAVSIWITLFPRPCVSDVHETHLRNCLTQNVKNVCKDSFRALNSSFCLTRNDCELSAAWVSAFASLFSSPWANDP